MLKLADCLSEFRLVTCLLVSLLLTGHLFQIYYRLRHVTKREYMHPVLMFIFLVNFWISLLPSTCYFPPSRYAVYCDQRVCLSVCPLMCLKNMHAYFTRFSAFLTSGHGFSDGSAIHYVLPVLWMTSCFYIMERMGQNRGQHV